MIIFAFAFCAFAEVPQNAKIIASKKYVEDYVNSHLSDFVSTGSIKKTLTVNCKYIGDKNRDMTVYLDVNITYPIPESIYVNINDFKEAFKASPLNINNISNIMYDSDCLGYFKLNTMKETDIYLANYDNNFVYEYFRYDLKKGTLSCDVNIAIEEGLSVIKPKKIFNKIFYGENKYDLVKFGVEFNKQPTKTTSLILDTGEKIKIKEFILSSTDHNSVFDQLFDQYLNQGVFGYGCFTYLNLNDLDVSRVSSISYLFNGCKDLISINTEFLNTYSGLGSTFLNNKLINGEAICLFANCKKLKYLDLGCLKTNKVADFQSMLHRCSSLEVLDISSFDLSFAKKENVNRWYVYFLGECDNLKTIYMTSETYSFLYDNNELPGGRNNWEEVNSGEYRRKS